MIWKILDWIAYTLEHWSHVMHRLKWRWHMRNLPKGKA